MEETKKSKELAHRAIYVREMRPYYVSAEKLIADMKDTGMITVEESIRRRASLLELVTGLVISTEETNNAPPQGARATAAPAETTKPKSFPYAPAAGINGPAPGGLPIVGATITPVVDEEGFCSARSIAAALADAHYVKPIIVGKMARALGIYAREGEVVKNEWGYFLPLTQNNKTINDNWRYSQKSQQILMATLREYIEKKRASSPRTRAGEVIAEVVANWPGYPLEPLPGSNAQTAQPN